MVNPITFTKDDFERYIKVEMKYQQSQLLLHISKRKNNKTRLEVLATITAYRNLLIVFFGDED